VQFHVEAGRAEMRVTNLPFEDYVTFPNGLADGHEVDATVSLDVVWGGPVTRRVEVEHGSNGNRFAGEFVQDHATVTWSGSNELGFRFRSNPGDFSTTVPGRAFAEVGRERNGAFVGDGEDDDAGLGRALRTEGPQGEEAALDRLFAGLTPPPRGGAGPAPSRAETGFDGGPASGARALRVAHPQAPDPAALGLALFTDVARPGADGFPR
jgi:hypothetical protein